jgi:hypothetical protein
MNAWSGLEDQVNALVVRLRPIGRAIGKAAQDGDALAQRVINSYAMLARRVDPMAYVLTKEALDEWERTKTKAGEA